MRLGVIIIYFYSFYKVIFSPGQILLNPVIETKVIV